MLTVLHTVVAVAMFVSADSTVTPITIPLHSFGERYAVTASLRNSSTNWSTTATLLLDTACSRLVLLDTHSSYPVPGGGAGGGDDSRFLVVDGALTVFRGYRHVSVEAAVDDATGQAESVPVRASGDCVDDIFVARTWDFNAAAASFQQVASELDGVIGWVQNDKQSPRSRSIAAPCLLQSSTVPSSPTGMSSSFLC